ncbi:MAG: hypothetical protein ACOYOS_13195 [Syntrophales bacterium]
MPRPKSILYRAEIDEAKRAHNCQHNAAHRLECGDKRLKVWDGRSTENYCVTCALSIIARDIAKLQELAERLRG